MSDTVEQMKTRLSAKYLGKEGIHAIGTRSGGVVTVYHSGPHSPELDEMRERIQDEAAPYLVQLVQEDPPGGA